MRLDVFLTRDEVSAADLADRAVVVVDVLRATSTIVEALSSGARAIYPVASIEDALRLANTFGRGEVLLCGERRCLPIEGFDLGNSPSEFTPERVGGKTLVMSTTNGTAAMTLAASAARVLVGSLLNLSAVVDELSANQADPVILCSGREGYFGLEDAVCAGLIATRLLELRPEDAHLNDGAIAAVELAQSPRLDVPEALFRRTRAGQAIITAGLEDDLAFCAQVDRHAVVPILHDRNVTLASLRSPEEP